MPLSTISIEDTDVFDQLFVDYVNGKSELAHFYNAPHVLTSYEKMFEQATEKQYNRIALVEVLKKQYQSTAIVPTAVQSNIEALLNSNTYTVCTGHQLCLLTGPLYFIYKIITTINLAEELNKTYTNKKVVPIYWMATEDHDFEEISKLKLFGKVLEWKKEEAFADIAESYITGGISTQSLTTLFSELKLILGESDFAKHIFEILQSAYLNSNNLADATRAIVNELFGRYGVVVLDANDMALKQALLPIALDDVTNNIAYNTVNTAIADLNKLGYKTQVNPREINFFITKNGKRERVQFDNGLFKSKLLNTNFTTDEFNKCVSASPELLSPNVVMRPVYQQLILPNLAYVGGPAELAYWLQFKVFFDKQHVLFPILVPRNFVLFVDSKINQQWNKLGFTVADYFKDVPTLNKKLVLKEAKENITLTKEYETAEVFFNNLSIKAESVDASLKAAIAAEKQKMLNGLKNIEAKLIKAEKSKNEVAINQISNIKDRLFPDGGLQERSDNFIPYYLKYGDRFFSILKEELNPFQKHFIILSN